MAPRHAKSSAYRPLLLSSGLHASAARMPGKLAVTCEDASRTYAELSERVRRVAGAAAAAGLAPGDRVA